MAKKARSTNGTAKKRNPPDLTLRNLRALQTKVSILSSRVSLLESARLAPVTK